MLKSSNNHFGDISKIKIPKIRAFYNLKGAKIAKKKENGNKSFLIKIN